jgi:hypothetical protein
MSVQTQVATLIGLLRYTVSKKTYTKPRVFQALIWDEIRPEPDTSPNMDRAAMGQLLENLE